MIYSFKPIYKPTLWGGTRLATFKGDVLPCDTVGESWELSDMPGDQSVMAVPGTAHITLHDLVLLEGDNLLGQGNSARFGYRFPLLVKLLDAHQDLSIQVHPDDAMALKRHNSNGKTEMWYVLETSGQDACVLVGLNKILSADHFRKSVEAGTVPQHLRKYPVAPGDVFYLPAGRIHSIGAGTLLAEIQQPSDITYRIFDFNRLDANGNPRQLHVDDALEAIDLNDTTGHQISYNRGASEAQLVNCSYFETKIYSQTHPFSLNLPVNKSFTVAMILAGEAIFRDGATETSATRGHTFLIAANTPSVEVFPGSSGVKILTASLPATQD